MTDATNYSTIISKNANQFLNKHTIYYVAKYGNQKGKDLASAAATLDAIVHWIKQEEINVKKNQFFESVALSVSSLDIRYLPTNWRRLKEKILEALSGVDVTQIIVPPRLGNNNASKNFEGIIPSMVYAMRATGYNFTNAHIIRRVSLICELTERKAPSKSWFEQLLAKQETKVLTAVGRYGTNSRKAQTFKSYNPIAGAVFAGDAWQMDGTRINMVGWNEDGKSHFLYVVAVRDVMSGACIGVSFGEVEDRYMYINALKMAVQKAGYLPYNLVLDKFPGHNTEEWINVTEKLKNKGVQVQYTAKATGKAQVERWFGTLQTVFMMQSQFYYGEGIMSKRPYAHRSVEVLKQIKKQAKLIGWDFDKACRETEMVLAAYNNTPLSKYSRKHQSVDQSPMQLFETSETPYVVKIQHDYEHLQMFGMLKKVQIRHNMVRTEIRKMEYLYPIADMFTLTHFKEVSVYYELENLDKVYIFSPDGEKYLCEAYEQKRVEIYSPNADFSSLAKAKQRAKQIDEAKKQLLKEKTEIAVQEDTLNILLAGFVPKADSEAAETQYLIGEGTTDTVFTQIAEDPQRDNNDNDDNEFNNLFNFINQL